MTKKNTSKDKLQRFIFDKAPVRGEYIRLQESFQAVMSQHPYPEPIRKLLGEALCVAALLSAIIKFKGRVSVQFRGQGKLKMLLAQCDDQFHVRGLARWEGELSYADLMESFNQGVLGIMLDSGPSNRYQGIVSWRGNSLAESIEGYFQDSEQLATKIWLTVNETSATGLLLQIIPSTDSDASADWDRITNLTKALQPQEMLALEYEELLNQYYPDDEIRIFDPAEVEFKCTCSRERGENAISILGREEAEAELKNNHTIVVTCDFCNHEYVFDRADVTKIFESKNPPPSSTQLH